MTAALARRARASGAMRDSVVVGLGTLVRTGTGLLRIIVVGAVLGPTFFANFFQTTNIIPNTVWEILAGPVLAMVVVPALVRAHEGVDPGRARDLLRAFTGFLLAGSVVAAGLLAALSPLIADLLTRGVPAAARAHAQDLTTLLVLFVAPQILLYTLAFVGAAAQQARHRFAVSTLAPCAENLGLVATLLVGAAVYGRGLEVAAVPVGLVVLLGVGSTISVAVHAAVQVVGAARVGLVAWPSIRWWRDPEARALIRYMVRSVRVAAFPTVGVFGLLSLAVTIPGGVLVLQMAVYVFNFPVALGGRAVSIAVLPGLSAAARREDEPAFAASTRQAVVYGLVVAGAALVLLVGFGDPVAYLLSQGELRGTDLVGVLGVCLMIAGVAQLPGALHEVARQALFARRDLEGPRRASALALGATVVVGAVAVLMPTPTLRLAVLCLALVAREATSAGVLLRRLVAALAPERIIDGRRLVRVGVGLLLALPVGVLGAALIDALAPGRPLTALLLALGATVTLAVFAAPILPVVRTRGRWST